MRAATVDALNALNRRFYAASALEFHETRKAPWPGFERTLAALPSPPTSVLDVGAGDGRFAAFLLERCPTPPQYLGVDFSHELLSLAEQRELGSHCRFVHADVLHDDWQPTGRFALIAAFGLMHHVPSLALRKRLLSKLAAHLEPGGYLVVTFWRLPEDPRFERRVLPIATYNRDAPTVIPVEDLEPGDTLLRWGAGDGPPRYCHFVDDAEISVLCAATGLTVTARFRSDGRGDALNDYVVLRGAR